MADLKTVPKSEYRKDVDGLRAVAVVCVIVNHLSHAAMPGGYLGVDIFFVISGYVITTSLGKSTHSTIGSQLLHFYSRRIKRLMPALLTMVFVGNAIIQMFDAGPAISRITGLTSIFGVANIFLMMQATNYFGMAAQRNMFAHTWSLGVEEQFYVLYPFLFRWRRPVTSKTLWDDRYRLGALALLSLVSLAGFIAIYRVNQPAAYFLMPFRFWELGLGCMLGLISSVAEANGLDRLFKFHPVIPLLAMVPALLLAPEYPVLSTILVVFASAFLIGSMRSGSLIYKILASRPFTYIGSISYSLYLWHWIVICASVWTIGIHAWSIPFQLALILLLSIASYHLIENPLRRAKWSSNRWGVLAIGIPSMVSIAALIVLMGRFAIPRYLGNTAAEDTADSPSPGYVAKYTHRKIDNCFASRVFDPREKDFRDNLQYCSAVNDKKLNLIFIGDSTAMDLFPMADKIYADGVASVVNVFQPGCKVPPLKTDPPICAFEDTLIRNSPLDKNQSTFLVIRENYSPRRIDGDLGEYAKLLESFLSRTSAAGMKVIYILPGPKYFAFEGLCTPQWFRPVWAMGAECSNGFLEDRGEQLARRRDVTDYLIELSRKRNDLILFDPFQLFCGDNQNVCTPIRNGKLIYRDEVHITAYGSELLVAPFEAFLRDHHLISDSANP